MLFIAKIIVIIDLLAASKICPVGHQVSGKVLVLLGEPVGVVERLAEDVGDLVGVQHAGPEVVEQVEQDKFSIRKKSKRLSEMYISKLNIL